MKKAIPYIVLVLCLLVLLDFKLPDWNWPSIAPAKTTAAVYVYEKGGGGVPPVVQAAIGKLNERGIIATTHEDGPGAIPEQYKQAVPAARTAGLPALVAMAGEQVVRTVSKPTTEAQVLEAVP